MRIILRIRAEMVAFGDCRGCCLTQDFDDFADYTDFIFLILKDWEI